jgi:hypothetical protein
MIGIFFSALLCKVCRHWSRVAWCSWRVGERTRGDCDEVEVMWSKGQRIVEILMGNADVQISEVYKYSYDTLSIDRIHVERKRIVADKPGSTLLLQIEYSFAD